MIVNKYPALRRPLSAQTTSAAPALRHCQKLEKWLQISCIKTGLLRNQLGDPRPALAMDHDHVLASSLLAAQTQLETPQIDAIHALAVSAEQTRGYLEWK